MGLFEEARAAALADGPDLRIEQALAIVDAYGDTLQRVKRDPVGDINDLPFPKETIKWAMLVLIGVLREPAQREALKAAYVSLAEWQDRAGLESEVFDSTRLRRKIDQLALAREFAARSTPQDRFMAASREEQVALISELRARGFW